MKKKGYSKGSIAMMIISVAISTLLSVLGSLTVNKSTTFFIISIVFTAITLILFLSNILLEKNFSSKHSEMNAEEWQNYYLHHRENAEESTKTQLSRLRKTRIATNAYSAFLGVSAIIASFGAYCSGEISFGTPIVLISAGVFNLLLMGYKKPFTKGDIDKNELYISEKDFPTLYSMAKKARDTVGCDEDIRIAILPDNNAGIAFIDGLFSVQLGAFLLNTLSEEEVYCILLHEFAHMIWEKKNCRKETKLYARITSNDYSEIFLPFVNTLFLYFTSVYCTDYELFRFAATLSAEEYADKAMSQYGDKNVAASALIKLRYFEYYDWEKGTHDDESIYESEEAPKTFYTDECERFKREIEKNREKWDSLTSRQILARNATHPTTKMRVEALGADGIKTLSLPSSDAFISDGKKALELSDELWLKYECELFNERKEEYKESKKKVEEWKENGKPVIMAEYRFMIQHLRNLMLISDAIELCDRVIDSLTETEANYAYYIKGNYLIHKYDPTGIEYLYKAMSNNNYVDEGLDMVGRFCCMTGMQKELDEYRKKAVELVQKQMDDYSHLDSISPKDNLSSEKLPEGMLERILEYVAEIDNGNVERIYLIRKTVSESFYSSTFIVKIKESKKQTEKDQKENFEFFDKLFCFLDTFSDHQFSLFDYEDAKGIRFDKIPESTVYVSEK